VHALENYKEARSKKYEVRFTKYEVRSTNNEVRTDFTYPRRKKHTSRGYR